MLSRLTLRPAPEVAGIQAERATKEYGECADDKPKASPRPLDNALLGHAVPHARAKDAVRVFDERKVPALDDVLLKLFAVVERDLLGVLEEARVREAQLALERGLVRSVLAEGGRDRADWR